MPRPLRHWLTGGIYHLTVRGDNREPIFLDTVDYQQYLLELRRIRDVEPYCLLAYALMPNHVHLVVESHPAGSLSRVMQRVATTYAHYFNAKHGRVGHVYQGRFYSNQVDRESYLLEVTRYVHLNPVRAHLAKEPSNYPWSSYRQYVTNLPDPLGLVESEKILGLFGATRMARMAQYRRFVDELVEWEARIPGWVQRLEREKLIPPREWLEP